MTANAGAPSLTPAHFWRWLLAGALSFAVVAQLEMAALLQLFAAADLTRVRLDVGGFQSTLSSLTTALAGGLAYAVYAATFLANYFFFQRLERVEGGGLVLLWLRSSLRLSAGILAAFLLRIALGVATAPLVPGGGPAMSWVVDGLVEVISNGAIGAGFGFLLWSLQHGRSGLLQHRAPSLRRAHILGGAIGGSLIALAGMALAPFQRGAPALLWLVVLALAVIPHLILTWRAMVPALADGACAMTGGGVFIARLLVVLVPVAAAGLALHDLAGS
jgi:hypothetical protein